MECSIFWTILVRTPSIQKLKAKHLPPVNSALGPMDFDWKFRPEDFGPGLIGAVTWQNLSADTSDQIVVTVLRKAYRLADGWQITGLGSLDAPDLRHVRGQWTSNRPAHTVPALEAISFQIEPGRIGSLDEVWFHDEPDKDLS